jgi:hypothetical protein
VAAEIWTGLRSQTAHLRRLAVAFATELRLKIVIELYGREMSARQFRTEFAPEESPGRVDYAFRELERHGWLRRIWSEGPGGRHRGSEEHFYRSTALPFIDMETWALLPYSVRVAFSWNTLTQAAEHLRAAMEAEPFGRPDRDLSVTSLLLDAEGWERVTEALAEEFARKYEEQEDARRRLARSKESPMRVNSILFSFQTASGTGVGQGPSLIEQDEPLVPFPTRISKVFEDEICRQIIEEANLREVSAPSFYAKYGIDTVKGIRRRMKMLAEIRWLAEVGRRTVGKRRGPRERFYRASGPAILKDTGPWANVPDSLKATTGWSTFERLTKMIKDAMVAGTFDGRVNRCLAWSILSLDQRGLKREVAGKSALRALALEEEARAKVRMEVSGEKAVEMAIAFGAFESPMDVIKRP